MATAQESSQFVLCIENNDAEDLQKGKIYKALAESSDNESGFMRVIDDSGEDYLYPESYFAQIDLPDDVKKALMA